MRFEHKLLIAVGMILLVGTTATVGLLYTTDDETDSIVERYTRSTQNLQEVTIASVIEIVESDDIPPNSSSTTGSSTGSSTGTISPPGAKPMQTVNNPNTNDGCYTNMALKQTKMGVQYYGESQTAPWTKGTKQHCLSQGCMWFAMSVATSYLQGNPVYVHELLHAAGGTSAKANSSGSSVDIQPAMNYVGIANSPVFAGGSVNATPASVIGALNKGFNVGNDNPGSGWYSDTFVGSGGIYLVHAKDDSAHALSSGGQHWFVVVGKGQVSGGQECYLVINGAGSQGGDGYVLCDVLDKKLDHCYEVTK